MNFRSSSAWLVVVGVIACSVVGALVVTEGPLALFHPWGSNTNPSDAQFCANLNGTQDLVPAVAGLYEGGGNGSGPGKGPIYTTAPGAGAYPAEGVAETQVVHAFYSFCESGTFIGLLQEYGSQNVSRGSTTLRNATGIFEFSFDIRWLAAQSSCASLGNQPWSCFGFATWTVNVATGEYTGPVTSYNYIGIGQ